MKASEAMNASNPIEPNQAEPKTAGSTFPYEPSMEEILASIRRIIADDQSLPRAVEVDRSEPSLDEHRSHAGAEPTLAPRVPPTAPPDAAPLRAHLLRGETVELDFRAMAARQTGLVPVRDPAPEAAEAMRDRAEHDRRSTPEAETVVASPASASPPVAEPQPLTQAPSEPANTGHAHAMAHGRAHGMIAAPQYAGPGGPEDIDAREQEAPAAEASSSPEMLSASLDNPPTRDPIDEERTVADLQGRADASSLALGLGQDRSLATDALFSAATDTSVTAAFRTLAATRLADNSEELLDIAREMIRPLLKNWIDDNVPSMVERMVRAEIERVARGGR